MYMRSNIRPAGWFIALALLSAAAVWSMPADGRPAVERRGRAVSYTDEFHIGDCHFVAHGRNDYFSLEPGYQIHLSGDDDGELVDLYITALHETFDVSLVIDGEQRTVRTRIIEEREYADGELFEISRNYYARCRHTNDIFYFGEDVEFYEDGVIVGSDGTWLAGVDGASPGIIMPGRFLLGSRYLQEVAPGVALDRAEHLAMGCTFDVAAGRFNDCVVVSEDSALEPDADSVKVYCRDIGMIMDDVLGLVSFGFIEDDDSDDSDDDDSDSDSDSDSDD